MGERNEGGREGGKGGGGGVREGRREWWERKEGWGNREGRGGSRGRELMEGVGGRGIEKGRKEVVGGKIAKRGGGMIQGVRGIEKGGSGRVEKARDGGGD